MTKKGRLSEIIVFRLALDVMSINCPRNGPCDAICSYQSLHLTILLISAAAVS